MFTADSISQRDWFLKRCSQLSGEIYFARTPTALSGGPRPDTTQHIISAVVRGTRYWAFATEAQLNNFLTKPHTVAMTRQEMQEHISL